nr:bifunctional diguanylate cyclase/phosphodiesterase [Mangrovicella endophytica]
MVSILSLGAGAVGQLVETAMREKGASFAALLISPKGNAEAFLTGIARNPDAESTIREVAALAEIDAFSIFDLNGEEVFSSRSERYKWLLRDRPGGLRSGDRLSRQVIERPGEWQIVYDDGSSDPSVITPLIRDGRTIGFVSIIAGMTEDRRAYRSTLLGASLSLFAVLLVATGIPLLVYLRRQKKMNEADERIHFLANHDPLTHLFNRTRMQEETDRVLATSRATREQMAFLFIDIDGLSEINDSLGQVQGDELLRIVARRLTSVVDRNDLLGRIGADDFTVLHRRLGGLNDLSALTRRIVDAVSEPVELAGQTVTPRISIGVAMVPKDGRTHSELVKHSELALMHHKAMKSGDFATFDPFMDEELFRRRQIEALLRAALEEDGFELFYQPIVSGDGSLLLGFEALIRLRDGEGGYVPPSVFIPIAEARGYIKAIGTWVIREATRQIAAWPQELFVSVNLSAVQFRDGDLVDIVRSAIEAAGIEGRRMEIEVVESLLLERSDNILTQLRELKSLGISIDMDDFGTGYSSLGYLWRFPFDKLKIDQSFMKAFEEGERNVPQIVETIVSMAHHMGMKVTAEGIETEAQVTLLRGAGCDQLQGYLFGKPMAADRVAGEILAKYRVGRQLDSGVPRSIALVG